MMLHADIADYARLAQTSLGFAGYGSRYDWSWKQDMAALLGYSTVNQIAEEYERQQAKDNRQLDYNYDRMTLVCADDCPSELKATLDLIHERQPRLKLYQSPGQSYWSFKGKKHDIEECNILRLEAPDGYCFDYEYDEFDNADGEHTKTAHVKFIMQRDVNRQGYPSRLNRHVLECTDVLFELGISFVWGLAASSNQFDVKATRHGRNWRGRVVRIKDAHGELSPRINRLLAMYLRQGWIPLGEQRTATNK